MPTKPSKFAVMHDQMQIRHTMATATATAFDPETFRPSYSPEQVATANMEISYIEYIEQLESDIEDLVGFGRRVLTELGRDKYNVLRYGRIEIE